MRVLSKDTGCDPGRHPTPHARSCQRVPVCGPALAAPFEHLGIRNSSNSRRERAPSPCKPLWPGSYCPRKHGHRRQKGFEVNPAPSALRAAISAAIDRFASGMLHSEKVDLVMDAIAPQASPPTQGSGGGADLRAALEPFARALESGLTDEGRALDDQLCCSGQDCGCRGSTFGQLWAHDLLKLAEPSTSSNTQGDDVLALADKAVAWALDALSGYSCEECDAGIHYAQARGFDRWSMQAQMDHPACFGCEGTALTAEGEPCPVCQPDPAQFGNTQGALEAAAKVAKYHLIPVRRERESRIHDQAWNSAVTQIEDAILALKSGEAGNNG